MITSNGSSHPESNRTTVVETKSVREPMAAPPARRSFIGLYILLFLIVAAVVVLLVFQHRAQAEAQLVANTGKMADSTVLVVHPERGNPQVNLTLPGNVQAEMETSVYAQVNGYVKRWLVDIGAPVKQGQLLAEIDTPVTDQQLKQAQNNVVQAQANLNLAQVTANRYNDLFKSHAVSQQDVDNQNANLDVLKAALGASRDALAGIEQTEAFKQVKAPFDGVVTARKIDVGDYVSASGQTASTGGNSPATGGTPNQELFRVAQITTLRVYVNVPENYADAVTIGTEATLEFASAPNQKAKGHIVRTSQSIDPNSLTLLTEVDVDNAAGKFLSGGYAQVHFDIKAGQPPLVIPGNTLIFRAQGPQVGVVDDSNTVHLKTIKIGRDFGTKLEVIGDDLKETDSVILNPSDSLVDGVKVQPKSETPPPKVP